MVQRNRDLYFVYAISFMDLFAVGLTVPLFSNHLRDLGASHFTVGLLNSIYSGLQVVSGPVVGGWSDVRDRKSVLTMTLLLSSISYIALGLTNSVLVIAAVRFLLGVTKHTQSLCKAIITDLLPVNERAGAFGRSSAFGSLGFIVGPTLGGHLSELSNGFTYVCALTSLLFVINIALTSVISETKNRTRTESSTFSRFRSEIHKSVTDMTDIDWRSLWDVFLLRFIFGYAVTMFFSQQSVYLKEQFELSQRYVGYTISYFSTMGTASAFSLHYISTYFYKDDESCLKRLSHFFLLMTVSLICLFLSTNIQLYLFFLLPFSLSSTILRIVSMELMLKHAASTHRGSLSGTSNSIMSVARFVTPMSSGLITDKLGGHMAMLFAAIPPLAGTVIAFRMRLKYGENKEKKK